MGLLLFRSFLAINAFNIATENPITPNTYRFPVHSVNECPKSENEFKTAAQRRNCTGGSRYLCVPNKYISSLIEFCTDRPRQFYGKGNCVILEGTGDLDHYNCEEKFNSSCPSESYYDTDIFKYPACLEIDTELRCFVADKNCSKRETVGNETFRRASPTCRLLAIVYIIAVVSAGMILILVIFQKRRKGESNQDTIKKDQDTAGKFYANAGSDIPFGKLFVELDKRFPMEKVRFLKDHVRWSCNIKFDENKATELENATFARDVFNILVKEEVFKPSDVIVMQFLLQETECEELGKKCVEYAKKHNAMHYYETPPDKDSQNVRFHVVANLRHFTAEDVAKIRKTVAEILDCSLDDVKVNGYLHSTSFFLVLSIKKIYIEKLLAINQHEKDKLMKLKIDYFKDDFHTIMLECTAGVKDEKTSMSLQSKSSIKQHPENYYPPNLKLNPNILVCERNQHEKDKLMKLKIDYFKDDFDTVMLERTAGVKDEETSICLQSKSSTKQPPKIDFPPNIKLNPDKLMTSEEPTLVTTMEHCKEIATILSKETILAVDCEGVYHGTRFKLTLLQIGTCKGDVYLFDVQENTDLLSNVQLKHLLESEEIEKVMFKCSKKSSALDHDFKVTLRNVFDIQVAHIILEEQKGRKLFPTLKLRNVCQVYSSTDKVSKDEEEIMKICGVETIGFWRQRPLTEKMVSVAAGHVKALIPEVYREQKGRIENFGLNQKFKERVLESVKLHIDRTVYTQRKDRINGHVMEILQSLENECTTNTKLQDFEKDSEERLALQIVDVEIAQNMSEIIQQLKKEYIDSYLDEILKDVKSDEAELLVTPSKLRFLNKTRGHPDKSIAKKDGRIRDEIQNIVLSSIERKYDVGTDVSLLSTCEQEILRDLPIWSDDDTNFPKVIKALFWRLLDNDLARKSGALHKHKENYRLNKRFYDQMEKFGRGPSSVPIPTKMLKNS